MRYLLALTALVALIISVILLLNFTASNPTGRRFSSGKIDLALSPQEKGQQGELIVAHDLGIPRNETDARACLCRTDQPNPPACNSCLVQITALAQNRRPDFITTKYMVEVKNHQGLLYGDRDWDQINDYAIGARELGIPLWVFVRTDTEVDPQFDEVVEVSGGRVVKYLAVPGHVDRVGQVATVTTGASLIALLLLLRPRRGERPTSEPTKPGSPVDNLEDFVRRVKDKKRTEIDKEDSRPR